MLSTRTTVLGGVAFAVLLTLSYSFGGMTGFASAATDDANVTLSVASTTIVTITPTLFNFSQMTLGDTNFSTRNDLFLRIKNDGSNDITNIYAHLDTLSSEQNNPIGSANANEYAAGRFLWIKNETSKMYHAGALSWNITDAAGGWPDGLTGQPTGTESVGFYRNTTGDYLWALAPDQSGPSSGYCNTTDATLEMKDEIDTGSNRDLDTNFVDYSPDVGDNNWGVAHDGSGGPLATGPLAGHYVAIDANCEKLYIYRFDADSQFPGSGNAAQYLVGPSGTSALTPGSQHDARVGAAVHQGVPSGQTNRTLLTVTAVAQ